MGLMWNLMFHTIAMLICMWLKFTLSRRNADHILCLIEGLANCDVH